MKELQHHVLRDTRVFGVSLQALKAEREEDVPKIVVDLVNEIKNRGMQNPVISLRSQIVHATNAYLSLIRFHRNANEWTFPPMWPSCHSNRIRESYQPEQRSQLGT
jgi:hypothetical protein